MVSVDLADVSQELALGVEKANMESDLASLIYTRWVSCLTSN